MGKYLYRERITEELIDAVKEYFSDDIEMRQIPAYLRDYQTTFSRELATQLSEIDDNEFAKKVRQILKEIKSKIGCSIDAKDDYLKHSEIWKILRGLQLLGISCNSISVEEMERCSREVKKSADFVKSVVPYDFPFTTGTSEPVFNPQFIQGSYLEAVIKEYQDRAWRFVGEVENMDLLMEEEYRKLKNLMSCIYDKMVEIEEREGTSETVDEVNKMLDKLKREAYQIASRINSGDNDLKKVWKGEYTSVLPIYNLPTNIAISYLIDCFELENEEFKVDAFHRSIANGDYDFLFDWDEVKAYEVTEGDTSFISREYAKNTPVPYTAEREYFTARLNGFHEYLQNRIRLFIGRLAKEECTKEIDSLENIDADLLRFTVDYMNKHFLKEFNEASELKCKKKWKDAK